MLISNQFMEWGISLKRRFFNTIRKKMIFMQVALLAIIMGIVGGVFIMYAENYYYRSKLHAMEKGFEELKDINIGTVSNEDPLIIRLEEQRFRLVIADENFQNVYCTDVTNNFKRQQSKIYNIIAEKVNRYGPEFTKRNGPNKIKGFGYIEQYGHRYYVYMYERKLNTKIHFSYYKLFFGMICGIALLAGIGVSWYISNRISRPIKNIKQATSKAIENNYEVNIEETQDFDELEDLAKSINIMMTRIRSQMSELEDELSKKRMVEERRRTFVNNVSHELKTPLAIISSQVEMLQLIDDNDKRTEYCASIIEETRSMAELINDMMMVYSTQNDEEIIELEDADISEIVKKNCQKYQDLFENETIILHEQYEEGCIVEADVRYIDQAVGNYITNSIKHSNENGNVYVRVFSKNDSVRVEVQNEGENIPEEYKDRIWDMFYRGDVTEKLQGQKGSGLGLYIVKSIVKLHNGKYGFDNLEKGVIFWFEIPKKYDEK